MSRGFLRFAAALFLSLTLCPALGIAETNQAAAWEEIDRLISELKLNEASARLDALLPALQSSGDADAWMRGLIRGAQLRAESAKPEEAVRFLQSQPWPEGERERAVLSLFYAEALKNYYDNYRWAIWKREAIQSDKPVDVEQWTTGQIFEAASRAYLEAWNQRETLSGIPVAELSDFLEPNTYPTEVRGTLRDTVTYLWVELLADTAYWSPAQSNATDRFDLPALFRGGDVALEKLSDPEAHPLVRTVTVLADLERWHLAQNNRNGALEARLERLRRLRNHALGSLRKELEAFLPAYRDIPWWAMGMAELAGLSQSEGDLVQAVKDARAGYEAYPDSPGGQACLRLLRQIEAPSYRFEAMASDGLARRSIQVWHRNLPALFFRAYPMDLEARLQETGPVFPLGGPYLLVKGEPAFAWRSDLPATPDHRQHVTFVTPPIDRPGVYVLVASARQDFSETENLITATPMVLGRMVLLAVSDPDGRGLEVTVLDGEHGEPLPDVEVTLYSLERWEQRSRIETWTSGADGRLRFTSESGERYAVAARKGSEVAFLQSVYTRGSQEEEEEEEEERTGSLVFTDRSLYRPQQKVLWKVLVYQDEGRGKLAGVGDTSIIVSLIDPNDQEVESKTVTTNSFGTAAGEFTIPPGRPLGDWRIETSRNGQAEIWVEEYKRPTFEVTLEDPAEPLRLGHPAAFTGQAHYFFGLPVTHGEVRWKAVREPVYSWLWYDGSGYEETVATGTAELDPDGKFQITFTPDPGDSEGRDRQHLTFRYKVSADLTDEGGETRSAERSFRLGWVSIEAEISPGQGLFVAGEPGTVEIRRQDLDGIGRAGEGSWMLFALQQPAETATPADLPKPLEEDGGCHTEGDRLRSRGKPDYNPVEALLLWEDGPQVASGTVRHGKDGKAELTLPALEPGAWRLRYETTDAAGERFSTWKDLIVAGPETRLALPALLAVDASAAHPGGKVRILAHSGFPGQAVWLETWKEGDLVRRLSLRMGRDEELIEVPIGQEDRGGFTLKLVTVRDHQLLELIEHVAVPWDDRRLDIELATFRDRIRPGGRETWTVKVKPASGEEAEATAAELLAYMYDRSLDLFGPHRPADPLSLYPDSTGAPSTTSSTGAQSASRIAGSGLERWVQGPDLRPDVLRFRFAFRRTGAPAGVAGTVPRPPPPSPPPPPPMPKAMRLKPPFTQELFVVAETPLLEESRMSTGATVKEPPSPELRSDFSETAFWQPHLLIGPDGTASVEFTAPDSVTSWSFWLHALTRDLRAGSLETEVRSVKDLMVRPYLPRFLREGDRAELQVAINNASGRELRGHVTLDVLDPGTDVSRLADFGLKSSRARVRFRVAAGSSTTVTFPITTPRGVGPVAFKVTAVAGKISDGELRSLPILPSRMHLTQSRFAALSGAETKELRFDDMQKADPARIDEQMVVTLDAQLFYSVLEALPYLVDYPYECTEQTLNRFLSTGIAASLYDKYPAVEAMAREMSQRETRFETWDSIDPNRKMALEETPWLELARGGAKEDIGLVKVLDPRVSRAQRDQSLEKLQQAQLDSGAFSWWPGGPPSPYMTLYLLYGFAKASEFGVEVPRDMVEKGWTYLADYYRTEADKKHSRELLVFLNYVASAYPDPSWMGDKGLTDKERKEILADGFSHWKELSGYLQALLALTLNRMGRPDDAELVFGRLLDLAKTTENEGTFWAPEEHAWLWYQDTIETHAFALLALMEISPEDPRRHGLVQWLFLNKQLNHWHSTRATTEVIYALVHYLEKEGQLGVREAATVRVGGQTTTFTFEPDRYTGKHNQVVATSSTVVVEKETPGLMFASATWHFSTEELPKEVRGDLFGVTRRYFLRTGSGKEMVLKPLDGGTVLQPGDEVEVQLSIISRAQAEYVHLRDPRPAGLEPDGARSGYKWDPFAPGRYEETRDSGTNFFFDWLPAGEYTLKYRLRANLAGTFRAGPATLQSMYAPEFTAYSAGNELQVAPAGR